eukprot:scaffold259_cov158-Amphora_coffeaeformis.AAC.13
MKSKKRCVNKEERTDEAGSRARTDLGCNVTQVLRGDGSDVSAAKRSAFEKEEENIPSSGAWLYLRSTTT